MLSHIAGHPSEALLSASRLSLPFTKIIIPSEIQNLAGLVTSIKEVATQPDPVEEADTTEK